MKGHAFPPLLHVSRQTTTSLSKYVVSLVGRGAVHAVYNVSAAANTLMYYVKYAARTSRTRKPGGQ